VFSESVFVEVITPPLRRRALRQRYKDPVVIEFNHDDVNVCIRSVDTIHIDGWQGYGGHVYIDLDTKTPGVTVNAVLSNRGAGPAEVQVECNTPHTLQPGKELRLQLRLIKELGRKININGYVYCLIAK
jgi:hypothetical protein